MSSSIAQNIEALCQEQGIERDLVIEAMKEAVRAAAKKQFKSGEDIQVDWNAETGIELSASKVVVDEVENPATELSIDEARELAGDEVELGDALLLPLPMEELGRIAAQTAKQILFQKVRDAVRSNVYEQYVDKIGDLSAATLSLTSAIWKRFCPAHSSRAASSGTRASAFGWSLITSRRSRKGRRLKFPERLQSCSCDCLKWKFRRSTTALWLSSLPCASQANARRLP